MTEEIPLFNSAGLKIQWANKHINDLNSFLKEFIGSGHYGIFVDKDPETGIYRFKAGSREGTPAEIPLMIGDTTHNLRSALDHIITEIAGGDKTSVYFPFHKDVETFISTTDSRVVKARRDINAGCPGLWDFIVNELKPYESGNHALWAITKLDAVDKHKFIIPIVTVTQVHIKEMFDKKHGMTYRDTFIEVRGDRAVGITASQHEFNLEGNVDFTLEVLFPPGGLFENQPVVPTLFNLSELVAEVLQAIRQFIADAGIVIGRKSNAA